MIAVATARLLQGRTFVGTEQDHRMFQALPSPTGFVALDVLAAHGPGNEECQRIVSKHGGSAPLQVSVSVGNIAELTTAR
jgi:hypothetical protein